MKPILLCAALLAVSTPLLAQPTLTGPGNNPTPGSSHHYIASDLSAPGSSGANVTWDFSSMGNVGNITMNYVACSSMPNCSTFPGSNLAIDQGGGTGLFLITDANRYSANGVNTGLQDIIYSDPEDFNRFPFTYMDSYTDSFSAIVTSPGGNIQRSGTAEVTADGYGTLILPWGTITNVLRIHRHEEYKDEFMGFPMFTYISDAYFWHKPGQNAVLATHITLEAVGVSTTVTSSYITPTTGINNLERLNASLNIYPNPASEILNLAFETEENMMLEISMTDMLGRQVFSKSGNYKMGSNRETIRTSDLPCGLYMLRIESNGQTISHKVQIL